MTKATYTNSPNRRAKGRILFDINNIKNDSELLANQDGIYFKFNATDNELDTRYKMMLIGPEDSPYVGGFYMFDAKFPDQYPYFPMTMKTRTQGGSIRKHPNLYVNGKCCFSFLGTWSGPPWTACQNPQTVAISMKSVLTNNPIVNEPGWETKNDSRTKLYETMVRYFNIRYAVIKVLNEINNSPFSDFKDAVRSNFIKFYKHYIDEVTKFEKYSGLTKNSPVYGFSVTFDVDYVKKELKKFYDQLSPKYETKLTVKKKLKIKTSKSDIENQVNQDEEQVNNSEEVLVNTQNSLLVSEKSDVKISVKTLNLKSASNKVKKKIIKIKKKAVRKAPKESATKFDEGYISVGLDGNNWNVKKYDSGIKRWVKCK